MRAQRSRAPNDRADSPALAAECAGFARRLARWFARARRDLPWRRTRDPYAVWISEVMLQQTRVQAVIPYYERFLARFPTAAALAAAREEDVLAAWAGLGYYARGRNLHGAARALVREHGGSIPADYDAIRALPGIGAYTAAAIGSIAFGIPRAVLDGNVERVLCRYHALAGNPKAAPLAGRLRALAELSLDRRCPGDHNQALMELGALVCTPHDPQCAKCPVRAGCRARRAGAEHDYPSARPRRAAERQEWIALVPRRGDRVVVVRTPHDQELLPEHDGFLLARLECEREPRAAAAALARRAFRGALAIGRAAQPVRHSITYRRLLVIPVSARVRGRLPHGARTISPEDASELPALYRKIVRSLS
ncbi:MAG: A/G-specific adenine glycosylase [Planctomycetes bacterium]|nr:A/G-specific adenine glycosylase [Planctomycetota bacterium]